MTSRLLYAGAAQGFPGLYQVNMELPTALAKAAGACAGPKAIDLQITAATLSWRMPIPVAPNAAGARCQ